MQPTARVNYVMNTTPTILNWPSYIVNSALQAEWRRKRAVDDGKDEEKGRGLPFALAI